MSADLSLVQTLSASVMPMKYALLLDAGEGGGARVEHFVQVSAGGERETSTG
jgi:hypothetical protein